MNATIARIFFLMGMWWICSGVAEPFFIALSGACVWVSWKITDKMKVWSEESLFQQPLQLFLYFGWLIKEITRSALAVTRIIWQVKPRITPQLFTIESKLKQDIALSLYGNSITLTPGTLCVGIAGKKMQIHALEKRSVADIKSGRMEKRAAKVVVAE